MDEDYFTPGAIALPPGMAERDARRWTCAR
jgi:hypothetical protein